ncbi:CocE/NonD family hydrolase [Spirulina major CS-329]|uniref:CocE/NonD family hydrolase n=1 Tax=Spirulina TaxID=1154 RepID=UPI00232F193F|nr:MULTISPECIES: CocE/NonD family hydrolase [Spirulina]MDB9494853.1 CocE/NonD family hydrolase [Spirulina subsalsa CS-330]MDB9502525.1 CocE/NonD family hydrolase [Spirulina major CS-329]
MHTRDGVRLDADVYCPADEGTYPVLLMRQPYGRAIASTVVYAPPQWYASQGYIVVIQDVRGRGTSDGDFDLFRHEVNDGYDAVNWAATLPGSSGAVGMYGFSYQGMTQLYAAQTQPEALKAIAPAMVGYDLYQDWVYENGAFCLQGNLGWAVQLAAETARRQGDQSAFETLYQAARQLPITHAPTHFYESLQKYAPFYFEWLNHPHNDDYWHAFQPQLGEVDLPMLHIGGWFDPYLRGNLRLYRQMRSQCQAPQYLLIGPWGHLPWGRRVGDRNYGPAANNPVDALQIRWFDHFLKGKDTGLLTNDPLCLFMMGRNTWQSFTDLPPAHYQFLALTSNGLASTRDDAGHLTPHSAETLPDQADILIHDPWRPAPSWGGHASQPAGSRERSHLDDRTDTLTYTTAPLTEPLVIAGEAIVELHCTASTPSYDLCAILSEVQPDGSVYNLAQGYIHLHNTTSTPIRIPLQATCAQLPPGHRLRLSISLANFPAYPINTGHANPTAHPSLATAQIITITLHSGQNHRSQLFLPLAPAPAS